MHVCLFDIDGTLILSGGAGKSALEAALADEFGIPRLHDDISLSGYDLVTGLGSPVGSPPHPPCRRRPGPGRDLSGDLESVAGRARRLRGEVVSKWAGSLSLSQRSGTGRVLVP